MTKCFVLADIINSDLCRRKLFRSAITHSWKIRMALSNVFTSRSHNMLFHWYIQMKNKESVIMRKLQVVVYFSKSVKDPS